MSMIYFNNAATSYPKPKEVFEAVNEYFNAPTCHSARTGLEVDPDDKASNARQKLARLFNVDDFNQIVFTSGSTEALNLAINGIGLKKGSHVVSTAIEHNSVIRPLKHLERDEGVEVDFVLCDEYTYVEPSKIEEAIKPNTKAVVVNHSSNVTGSILDLEAISSIAHKHGALIIVDASQSAGNIPIDVKSWDIDLLSFTGHKSLYGIQGIGGLYLKKGLNVKPLKVGGTGLKSEVLTQPTEMPLYYEAGTPNMPGIVSLDAGVGYILEKGIDVLRQKKVDIVKTFINEFKDYPEIDIYTRGDRNSYVNFCFNIRGMVPEEVGYVLDSSYDITVRTGLHCAPMILKPLGVYPWGTVRVSPSSFTVDSEVDKFIEAIKETVKTFVRKEK
ncbi:MAG: aminotransferase class V-fold PLP-dependent enzyme [Ignavibacteriae bacterium]|nr:aminotransferase class V-fold PLP-dependent enzyme [Ignavibacteriota bacterium]